GIRDFHVTGVQTCALPIFLRPADHPQAGGPPRARGQRGVRPVRRRLLAHHGPARPGRRRGGGGLPAVTPMNASDTGGRGQRPTRLPPPPSTGPLRGAEPPTRLPPPPSTGPLRGAEPPTRLPPPPSTGPLRGAEPPALAAVDLGATSGRVVLGRLDAGRLSLEQVARFPNTPVRFTEGRTEGLHWNIQALYGEIEEGLRRALRSAPGLSSIGIDAWAVDYALLRGGRMLGVPYHYRDPRSSRGVRLVHAEADAAELFSRNGLQHLDFNTVFQLA